MTRIRTVLVDDEQLAQDELRFLLEKYPHIDIVGQASNGVEALSLIRNLKPDLLFLDIQMPGMDGFQVISHLLEQNREILPKVIFVTAYDQYALKAFEVHALDYLLKPIDEERLADSLQQVCDQLANRQEVEGRLQTLLDALARPGRYLKRVSVKRRDRIALVDTATILYAYISSGVVSVVTTKGEETTSYRTLEELELDLDPEHFCRVHRSYIANINWIAEIIPWFSGTYHLKMRDARESEIPLSRSQARRLRKLLKW